jgi:MFS transporter, DHA1 family, tetracycline resistance protein
VGHTRAFFAAAAFALINTIYGYFVLDETLAPEHRRPFDWKRANPVGAFTQLRSYPLLGGLIIAVFLYNIGHHVYPANWSFYTLEKFNWTPRDVGLSMGFVGILMALVQGGLIRIAIPRLGASRTALIGFTSAAMAYIGIALAPNGLTVYLWCFVSALSGFIMPSIQGLLSNRVPANQQGELQGVMASVASVGSIIGPLLMTQTFAAFTGADAIVYFPGAAFMVAGLMALLAIGVFMANVRHFAPSPAPEGH